MCNNLLRFANIAKEEIKLSRQIKCRQIRRTQREREREKTLANMQRGSNFAGAGNSTIGLSHTQTHTHTQTYTQIESETATQSIGNWATDANWKYARKINSY